MKKRSGKVKEPEGLKTSIHLGSGRKPEYSERTHADGGEYIPKRPWTRWWICPFYCPGCLEVLIVKFRQHLVHTSPLSIFHPYFLLSLRCHHQQKTKYPPSFPLNPVCVAVSLCQQLSLWVHYYHNQNSSFDWQNSTYTHTHTQKWFPNYEQ